MNIIVFGPKTLLFGSLDLRVLERPESCREARIGVSEIHPKRAPVGPHATIRESGPMAPSVLWLSGGLNLKPNSINLTYVECLGSPISPELFLYYGYGPELFIPKPNSIMVTHLNLLGTPIPKGPRSQIVGL